MVKCCFIILKKIISFFLPKCIKIKIHKKLDVHKKKRLEALKIKETELLAWHNSIEYKLECFSKKLEKTLKKEKKFRFGVYIISPASDGSMKMIDFMIKNPKYFLFKIVIIPDIQRGMEHAIEGYNLCKKFYIEKYGSDYIIDGWDDRTNSFFDVSCNFDVIYNATPYDNMKAEVHKVKYIARKGIPQIFIEYGYENVTWGINHIYPLPELAMYWKVFTGTTFAFDEYVKYSLAQGKNAVLSGYPKMDTFPEAVEQPRKQKRIILAPHHTIGSVTNYELPLSNFLSYYNLILELPKIFPNVDFVFRPHQLLFTNLINFNYWTKEKVDIYINEIKNAGIKLSIDGEYFSLFVNSDAIIHDCGSFITEWLFTGKPCCFVVRDEEKLNKILNPLGKESIKNYKLAYNQHDIIKFIQDIVDGKNFPYTNTEFMDKNVKINYPNASLKILDEITMNVFKIQKKWEKKC